MKSKKIKTKAVALAICAVLLVTMSGVVSANIAKISTGTIDIQIKDAYSQSIKSEGTVNVAVYHSEGGAQAIANVLNTDPDIKADVVDKTAIESGVLSNYDVLLIRTWGNKGEGSTFKQAVSDFVKNGGGYVGSWWGSGITFTILGADHYPGVTFPMLGWFSGTADKGDLVQTGNPITIIKAHPVVEGLPSQFSASGGTEHFVRVVTTNPALTTLATYEGFGGTHPAIMVGRYFQSNVALILFDAGDNANDANLKTLFINSVKWAASGAPTTPTVSISTGKYSYTTGDTMHVGLDVANPGDALPVRFALWLELLGGDRYVHTYTSVTLPAGLDYSDSNFAVFTLPSIPAGTYTWHAALIEPSGSIVIISQDITSWEFGPAVAGAPTEDIARTLEQIAVAIDFDE